MPILGILFIRGNSSSRFIHKAKDVNSMHKGGRYPTYKLTVLQSNMVGF
jgi:hypothetical protein